VVATGGPQMEKIWFFDFEQRSWSSKTCTGGLSSWSFGHAHKRGKHLLAYGTPAPPAEEGYLEVSTASLSTKYVGHLRFALSLFLAH